MTLIWAQVKIFQNFGIYIEDIIVILKFGQNFGIYIKDIIVILNSVKNIFSFKETSVILHIGK